MILTALAAGTTTAVVAAEGGEGFETPTPDIFWLPLIGEGDWAITSVLHDATSVVTRFHPLAT